MSSYVLVRKHAFGEHVFGEHAFGIKTSCREERREMEFDFSILCRDATSGQNIWLFNQLKSYFHIHLKSCASLIKHILFPAWANNTFQLVLNIMLEFGFLLDKLFGLLFFAILKIKIKLFLFLTPVNQRVNGKEHELNGSKLFCQTNCHTHTHTHTHWGPFHKRFHASLDSAPRQN